MTDPERLWLALDTSSSIGTVAVGTRGKVRAEVALDVRGGHSAALLPAIDHALRSAGGTPADLGAVVVGSGPGSFTGLRIAAATAKGVVHALQIPLYAHSSLLAAAAQAWAASRPVCALFDARGRDLFAACYAFSEMGSEVLMAPGVHTLEELLELWPAEEAPLFLGDGAERHQGELEARFGAAALAPPHFGAPRAAALLWLAQRDPEQARVEDPFAWEPDYLRPSGAERIAAARAAAATPS